MNRDGFFVVETQVSTMMLCASACCPDTAHKMIYSMTSSLRDGKQGLLSNHKTLGGQGLQSASLLMSSRFHTAG